MASGLVTTQSIVTRYQVINLYLSHRNAPRCNEENKGRHSLHEIKLSSNISRSYALRGDEVLPKVPGNAPSNFRIGIIPIHCTLIAGIHAGATFDTIFYLEMYLSVVIHGVAVGGTNIGCTFMGTSRVTDIGINHYVWFNI